MKGVGSTVAAVLLLSACTGGTRQVDVGPDGSIAIEGIEIPASFGAYSLSDVKEYEIESVGSGARYLPHDSVRATMPHVDLFVYPTDGLRLASHADNERRNLLQIRPRGVQDVQVGTMSHLPPPRGIHPIHVVPMRLRLNGADLRSIMYISRVGERNLKVRVSYPAAWGYDMDEVAHAQVRLLIGDIVRRSER